MLFDVARHPCAARSVGLALVLLAGASLATGCATSPEARFYALRPLEPTPEEQPAASGLGVLVEPVDVPDYLDRPQLLSLVGTHELRADEYHRWAEPLDDMLTRLLVDDLTRLLGTTRIVARGQLALDAPDATVKVAVGRVEAVPGRHVLLEARFTVGPPGERAGARGPSAFSHRASWADERADGLVAALQEAFDALARAVADTLVAGSIPSAD